MTRSFLLTTSQLPVVWHHSGVLEVVLGLLCRVANKGIAHLIILLGQVFDSLLPLLDLLFPGLCFDLEHSTLTQFLVGKLMLF